MRTWSMSWLICTLLVASSACGGDGRGQRDAGEDASPDGGEEPTVDHLFALFSCLGDEDAFCPGGDPEQFDRDGFRDIYADPFGEGPSRGLYPSRDTGSYHASPVPQCDDASIPDPVETTSNADPSTWVCPDGSPTIRCTDGTRPLVYYFPADDPSSTRWIVGISTGGAACVGDACVGIAANNLHRFSSVFLGEGNLAPDRTFSAGLFQRSEFSDFHRVIIDQCSGGRGLGAREGLAHFVDEETGRAYDVPLYHHGTRIVRAVLDRILRESSEPPTQIVFASQSNGSRGAYTEIDTWRAWLEAHPLAGDHIDVRLYANSLVHDSVDIEVCRNAPSCADLLDAYDHTRGGWADIRGVISAPGSTDLAEICPPTGVARCLTGDDGEVLAEVPADGVVFDTLAYQPGGFEGDAAEEWGVELDRSCLAAHAGETSACIDAMHVLLYHLETPTYFALSGYDRYMRSENVSSCSRDFEAWSLEDYHERLLDVARALQTPRPGQRDPVLLPGHGVWIDNSADHEGPTNVTKFDRELELTSGEVLALHESLRHWLDATDAHAPLCISDGEPRVNPTNPMNTSHGGTPLSDAECF